MVILILAAFTIACFLLPDQATQSLRKETLEIFGPVLRVGDKPVRYFSRVNTKLETLDQAQAELEKLKQQVSILTVQNQILQDKTTENARLREMLGFRDASPYRLRACRVESRQPSRVGHRAGQHRLGATTPTSPRTSPSSCRAASSARPAKSPSTSPTSS